jgi:hypothetical protein
MGQTDCAATCSVVENVETYAPPVDKIYRTNVVKLCPAAHFRKNVHVLEQPTYFYCDKPGHFKKAMYRAGLLVDVIAEITKGQVTVRHNIT